MLIIRYLLTLTHGGAVDLSSLDDDTGGSGPGTDDQKLSLSGTKLSIEDGNTVDLEGLQDADADPQNEIQKLSRSGNRIRLSSSGGEVTDKVKDADADPQNEIQEFKLNKSNNTIPLSKGGGSVDLGNLFDQDYAHPWDLIAGDIRNKEGNVVVDGNFSVTKEIELHKIRGGLNGQDADIQIYPHRGVMIWGRVGINTTPDANLWVDQGDAVGAGFGGSMVVGTSRKHWISVPKSFKPGKILHQATYS